MNLLLRILSDSECSVFIRKVVGECLGLVSNVGWSELELLYSFFLLEINGIGAFTWSNGFDCIAKRADLTVI